jgi:hypothetical protein
MHHAPGPCVIVSGERTHLTRFLEVLRLQLFEQRVVDPKVHVPLPVPLLRRRRHVGDGALVHVAHLMCSRWGGETQWAEGERGQREMRADLKPAVFAALTGCIVSTASGIQGWGTTLVFAPCPSRRAPPPAARSRTSCRS